MSRKDKLQEKFLAYPKRIAFKDFKKVMENNGWELTRIKGSHHRFKSSDGNKDLTVPVHDKEVKIDYIKLAAQALGLEED